MPITISKRLKTAAQLTRGLFLTDPNRSPWGRVWQLFSRFTWELPQTLMGWLYSVGRALTGQIDRVDTLGGITFATKSSCAYLMGVSLGTFVDLWTVPWMRGEGEGFVLANPLIMLMGPDAATGCISMSVGAVWSLFGGQESGQGFLHCAGYQQC